MRNRVYLDWNATTPLRAEARRAMLADAPALLDDDADAPLRRDIRELGALLGRTLVRQEGAETAFFLWYVHVRDPRASDPTTG